MYGVESDAPVPAVACGPNDGVGVPECRERFVQMVVCELRRIHTDKKYRCLCLVNGVDAAEDLGENAVQSYVESTIWLTDRVPVVDSEVGSARVECQDAFPAPLLDGVNRVKK